MALRKGISKEDLDETIGIHPVAAEEFIEMTKLASDKDPEKGSC